MHRFKFNGLAYLFCTFAVTCHAGPFSDAEKAWIDAHPIIKFSIHEKYAPYLNTTDSLKDAGVFKSLLTKMQECTGQEFIPIWRNSDHDVLKQLAAGEVDFIIDPPTITGQVLQVGTLSESIFWGHDAIITKTSNALENPIQSLKLA